MMCGKVVQLQVFLNKLIERIDITDDTVVIHFKVNLDHFCPQPRMTINERVQRKRI